MRYVAAPLTVVVVVVVVVVTVIEKRIFLNTQINPVEKKTKLERLKKFECACLPFDILSKYSGLSCQTQDSVQIVQICETNRTGQVHAKPDRPGPRRLKPANAILFFLFAQTNMTGPFLSDADNALCCPATEYHWSDEQFVLMICAVIYVHHYVLPLFGSDWKKTDIS